MEAPLNQLLKQSIKEAYIAQSSTLTTNAALARFIKQTHKHFQQILDATLTPQSDILQLLEQRARWLDEILLLIWQQVALPSEPIVLMALGGYGLGRIHPGSDADILLLYEQPLTDNIQQKLHAFVALIWDCGIKLGSSVRSLTECHTDAIADLGFYTNLLSMRLLAGNQNHFQDCYHNIHNLYTFADFFHTKLLERQARYDRFQHTEYGLEPSIKESPGGLRDCDFITWLALKKYQQANWQVLLDHGDITQLEYDWLKQANHLLWHIRYRLHLYSDNKSERLYFEYQAKIADDFGFTGKMLNDKISAFMQQYYQTVSEVREITDILSQYFTEMLQNTHKLDKKILTPYCLLHDKTLEISDQHFLKQHPDHLLTLFVLIANNDHISGFTAKSLRFIRELAKALPRNLLYTAFSRQAFLSILTRYQGVFKALSLLHRLGLLTLYLPQMASLSGQMQYDLYHLYTVDAHTLFVIRSIEWLFANNPLLTNTVPFLPKDKITTPEILFLAGLLHDISKGQGGDHSGKGALIAEQFCQEHGLNSENAATVAWLVKHHLVMSEVAQHQDIGNEVVITSFCGLVNSENRLNLLYLLTIADIYATNPTLWNHWRSALLRDLYTITTQSLNQHFPIESSSKQGKALALLTEQSQYAPQDIQSLWQLLGEHYFQLESVSHIVWHTQIILQTLPKPVSFALKPHRNQAGTDIFIYAPADPYLFASVCAMLEKCFLTIVQARISAGHHHYTLQSYVVLEQHGLPINNPSRLQEIEIALQRLLSPLSMTPPMALVLPTISRHVKRTLKFFEDQIHVDITLAPDGQQTCLNLHAPDFPGLLARIAEAFVRCNILVNSAIINTLDAKVEDKFYIADQKTGQPLTDPERQHILQAAIIQAIKLNN